MAYMSQEKKAAVAPAVKRILEKYKVKGSLAVRHHSTLVLNIKSGALDFIGDYNRTAANRLDRCGEFRKVADHIQVNEYHLESMYTGKVLKFLTEVKDAMNVGNHDRSDSMVDYFDVGWYVNINVGKWDKPYSLEK